MMAINPKSAATRLSLVTGLEACSSIMDAPHEYFDPTTSAKNEKIHYFFAYPSDYADTAIVYNDKGVLERKCQQAAFEVIFDVTASRLPWNRAGNQ